MVNYLIAWTQGVIFSGQGHSRGAIFYILFRQEVTSRVWILLIWLPLGLWQCGFPVGTSSRVLLHLCKNCFLTSAI